MGEKPAGFAYPIRSNENWNPLVADTVVLYVSDGGNSGHLVDIHLPSKSARIVPAHLDKKGDNGSDDSSPDKKRISPSYDLSSMPINGNIPPELKTLADKVHENFKKIAYSGNESGESGEEFKGIEVLELLSDIYVLETTDLKPETMQYIESNCTRLEQHLQ